MPALLISWLVVGVAAGLLTHRFSRTKLPGGLFTNLLIGVVGASVGGYLISDTTGTDVIHGAITWGILIVAMISALVVSVIAQYELTRERTSLSASPKE